MRIPQTPERIKEAPAQALRAVFAGVGQVLLMTERLRRKAMGQEQSQAVSAGALDTRDAPAPSAASTSKAEPAKTSTAKAGTAKTGTGKTGTARTSTAKTSTARTSTGKTGTARTSTAKATAATKPGGAKADTAPAKAATPAKADTAPAKADTPASSADSAPAGDRGTGVLPVPHYSELSVASLRARLRGLDIAQVRDLLAYERTHEDRANVIAMFERRIAKLEEAEGADPAAG